ncbi:MAG: hypothetical protein AAFN76_12830 [Pseudomonadota bacterium]
MGSEHFGGIAVSETEKAATTGFNKQLSAEAENRKSYPTHEF